MRLKSLTLYTCIPVITAEVLCMGKRGQIVSSTNVKHALLDFSPALAASSAVEFTVAQTSSCQGITQSSLY
jgi:hypothetical protein